MTQTVALPPHTNSTLNRRTLHRYASGQLHIRRRREKSTLILVSIVMIFLGCHIFRVSLQVHVVWIDSAFALRGFLHPPNNLETSITCWP